MRKSDKCRESDLAHDAIGEAGRGAGEGERSELPEVGEERPPGVELRRAPGASGHVLLEPAWLAECRRLWTGLDWTLVGVRCPLAVIEQRERERRDRTLGQAAAQFAVVHAHGGTYDAEVDTSELSPEDAAARIVAALS